MSYKSDLFKADRIDEAREFPEVLLIDNCSACNLQCTMCDHRNIKKYRKVEIMDMGLYRRIVDEIAGENPSARVWEIFFGDPFLCRDMPGRIAYAKEKGLTDVVLNSNGVLMSGKKALAVIKAGLDSMYVGIDAAGRETYDKIRVGGNFTVAVRNVLAYRDMLASHGSAEQKLFVQFVISDINENEVGPFTEFWKKEGVNVKIRPKISWAGLVKAANLYENECVQRKPCYWLMQTINICTDGRAALCSVDIHCRVSCGDVSKSSIKEVWHGKLKEYRKMHKQLRFDELPPVCRDCSDWQSAYAEFEYSGTVE